MTAAGIELAAPARRDLSRGDQERERARPPTKVAVPIQEALERGELYPKAGGRCAASADSARRHPASVRDLRLSDRRRCSSARAVRSLCDLGPDGATVPPAGAGAAVRRFDPNSPDPIIRALAAQEQRRLEGIVRGGRLVALPPRRCSRCNGRRTIVWTWDGLSTEIRPCPACTSPEPPPRSVGAFDCELVEARAAA